MIGGELGIIKKLLGALPIALVIFATVAIYWFINRVPFGTLILVETVSNQIDNKHAAIFKYKHGDSSADVIAIWLLEGEFTEITENDLKGGPAVVWPINQKKPLIKWQSNGRLLIEVQYPINLRSEVLWDCYSPKNEPIRPYLCFSSNEIDLRVIQ